MLLCYETVSKSYLTSTKRFATSDEYTKYTTNGIQKKPLLGKIACVTGASRGIGKGIAVALAMEGATVYITGRSLSSNSLTEKSLGGTLLETSQEIQDKGGIAIPICVDHSNDTQVQLLFQQIENSHNRLDILVNNAFQIPQQNSYDNDLLYRDFWEQPGWFWDSFMNVGLRSHYISSVYAFPLLKQTSLLNSDNNNPIIVHVSSFGGISYSFNVAYGVGKAGVDRMARDMSFELKKHNIACLSIYPGVVRTERMAGILDSNEWFEKTGLLTPSIFIESPLLTGLVISKLYQNDDNNLEKLSGKVVVTAELAKSFQISDPKSNIIPPSIRSLKFLFPSLLLGNIKKTIFNNNNNNNIINNNDNNNNIFEFLEKLIIFLSPDILLPMFVMQGGPPKQ
eukprot:gene4652-6536_t